MYETIRERVSALEAAERYGLEVKRGKALCIWHNDRHPSLSFKGQFCKCFSCGAGGSALDVTMQLFGLEVREAAAKLNEDFRLGLDIGKPVPVAVIRKNQEDKQLSKALDEWFDRSYDTLARYRHQLISWQTEYAPKSRGEPFHSKFQQAFREIDVIDWLLDQFESTDKLVLFKLYRQEVAAIEPRC